MNQRETASAPSYNQIRIKNFLSERIDLRDFCFLLEHKLENQQFAYRNIGGETSDYRSMNLVIKADAFGYLGELVYQLVDYWLNRIYGNPRVLVAEGIHIELSIYRQELTDRGEQEKAEQVLVTLKLFVPLEHFKDMYFAPAEQTPSQEESDEQEMDDEMAEDVAPTIQTPSLEESDKQEIDDEKVEDVTPDIQTLSPEKSDEPTFPPEVKLSLSFIPQTDGSTQVIWDSDESGRCFSSFQSPFNDDLRVVIKALDAVQWPTHPQGGPQFNQDERNRLTRHEFWANDRVVEDIDRRVGLKLYQALVADTKAKVALGTVRNHAIKEKSSLAYLLRFHPNSTELAAHPWELLWDTRTALMVGRGTLNSFTRFLDLDEPIATPAPPGTTLRILAIIPQAGIPANVRAEERQARETAWSKLIEADIVTMEELNPATPSSLVDRVQRGPSIDILHFYGHGRYKNGQGELLFDSPEGGTTWLRADQLAALLGGTKLVMLHACQSAMISNEGLITGVAPALSAAGVSAVVAMQLTVRIAAATRFSSVVYRSLARGESVQRAVSLARQALYVEEVDRASWFVPTLTICTREIGPLHLVNQA